MSLILVSSAWLFGVVAGNYGPTVTPLVAGVFVAGCGVCALRGTRIRLAATCAAMVLLGMARVGVSERLDPSVILPAAEGAGALAGSVVDVAPLGRDRASILVEATSISVGGSVYRYSHGAGPRILVTSRGDVGALDPGDQIAARGLLAEPRSRPAYPRAEILARRGVLRVLDFAVVDVTERSAPGLASGASRLRRWLEANLRLHLAEPALSLAAGVALGSRGALPSDLRYALSQTGTSHIVAVSGFNVVVIAGVARAVARLLLGRRWSVIAAVLAIWLYVALAGWSGSAVRAGLMCSLTFAAAASGRRSDAVSSLLAAAAAMSVWDSSVIWDLGFQLSALATAGLVVLAPEVAMLLWWLPRALREPLAVALAAHIATLPLIVAVFNTMSIVSPLANLLVGPAIPPLMLVAGLLAVLGGVPILGAIVAPCVAALCWYVLGVIQGLAELPGASVHTGRFPEWLMVAWYGATIIVVARRSADFEVLGRRRVAALVMILVGLLLPPSVAAAGGPWTATRISVLDTGGPSAFVRSPDGRTAVVSGSPSPTDLTKSVANRLGFLERSVDVVVGLSTDGRFAMEEVLRRYPPIQVLGASSARVLSTGDSVEVGAVSLQVVDERDGELDVALSFPGGQLWLPSSGEPSDRWRPAAQSEVVVARLARLTPAWIRRAPELGVTVVIVDDTARRLPDPPPFELLTHRRHGAFEVALAEVPPVLRAERCSAGDRCEWSLAPPSGR
ncbi:MAG: ComEC/Rec2 family competence protein [Chloroflexota bacterium]